MHHPLLAVLFYGFYFVGAVMLGVYVLGPVVRRAAVGKLRGLVAAWLVLVTLFTAAQYYGGCYLNDGHPPMLRSQALMPCFFVTMFTAALASRIRKPGKGAV